MNTSPAQFGDRNDAPKRKRIKAILPTTPGMIAPGCDTSTNTPINATINNRNITLGSSNSDKMVFERLFIAFLNRGLSILFYQLIANCYNKYSILLF